MSQSPGLCRCGYVLLADGRCAHCYSTIGELTGEAKPIGLFSDLPMTDHIEPALTPDLLSWLNSDPDDVRISLERGADQTSFFLKGDLARLIALANAALPDDEPRKITRETIVALDWVLEQAGCTGDYTHSVADKLRPIRDALASYLPPE